MSNVKLADLEAIFAQHGTFDPSGYGYTTDEPHELLQAILKELEL